MTDATVNVYPVPSTRPVIVAVLVPYVTDPPPVATYDVAPVAAVHDKLTWVVPVIVAVRLVTAAERVGRAARAVDAVLPLALTAVNVNGPYDVPAVRLEIVVGEAVIPMMVVNPVPDRLYDVAPFTVANVNVSEVCVALENTSVGAGGNVRIVPDVPAAPDCAPLNPVGPVAVTENMYPLPAVRPVNAADVADRPDCDVGVGVPVPVITYTNVLAPPLGLVHTTVNPVVVGEGVTDKLTAVGAVGFVYIVPGTPVPVVVDPPTVPVPPSPPYDVIVIGP